MRECRNLGVQMWLESAQCGDIPQNVINIAKNISYEITFMNKPTKTLASGRGNSDNSWYGKRPFTGAMDEYYKYMNSLAVEMMEKLKRQKSHSYVEQQIRRDNKMAVMTDGGTIKSYSWDTVHYGPIRTDQRSKSSGRKKRDTPWISIGYKEHPFKTLQTKFKKLGYYLYDESDGNSRFSRIRMYSERPSHRKRVWHSYNTISSNSNSS